MKSRLLNWYYSLFGIIVLLSLAIQPEKTFNLGPQTNQSKFQLTAPVRRVNISNLQGVSFTPAIFWLGKVDPQNNYADVRVYYYNDSLKMAFQIIDRRLWQDNAKNISDIANWDAVSVYLDLDGNVGNVPNSTAYRIDFELNNIQASYRGNNSNWISTSIPITVSTVWRGSSGPNSDQDAKGWEASLTVPFKSLKLGKPPAIGSSWGLGVVLHDRDDANGTTIRDTVWPETMNPNIPATWGQLHFGLDNYIRSPALTTGENTIQNGLNGAIVQDAEVGGNTTCGSQVDHWTQWGNTNYAGYTQVNIQNQWDIADWPCFSKYYVTFPLEPKPANKSLISATLIMHLFGNAGGGDWGEPPDSYIQVFTIGEDWNEDTLTWNNEPLALENISGTWVHPMDKPLVWPGIPYQWNVSRAVAEAYAKGIPLRLALYSADGDRHTGKYFSSSETGDWNAAARPTLQILWGIPCESSGVNCNFDYLPLTIR
jgi:hypothetical protein